MYNEHVGCSLCMSHAGEALGGLGDGMWGVLGLGSVLVAMGMTVCQRDRDESSDILSLGGATRFTPAAAPIGSATTDTRIVMGSSSWGARSEEYSRLESRLAGHREELRRLERALAHEVAVADELAKDAQTLCPGRPRRNTMRWGEFRNL
jgi:hypothetical protein